MKYLILLCIGMSSFVACNQPKATDPAGKQAASSQEGLFENVDIAAAKALMSDQPGLVLIDVRTPEEIAAGKIDNALEIDFSSPDFAQKIAELDKNTPYLVYCAAGGRSKSAMEHMKQSGFTQVYNLMDGYNGWAQSGQTR